ncbi:hypothetical protein AS593_07490 [Caulobacter vibrioides]|nr:hypothetical protein AS593_07490 [Caulobacter vibrioides]
MRKVLAGLFLLITAVATPALADDVRLKDLGRFLGWRDNPLYGYGVVTGLAGTGDSPRNEVTQQALRNTLGRVGANVSTDQVRSRNAAVVMVTAVLAPSANIGDRMDVTVTSLGDARSLVGGTLMMTQLLGPDERPYAIAQGPLVVGGYRFDSNFNQQQRNFPTAGVVPEGARVEVPVEADILQGDALIFVLKEPDFTTANRIADGINAQIGYDTARVQGADAVWIKAPQAARGQLFRLISRIENVTIRPDSTARVVINERTGTVVAGGGVQISSVVVSQGDVRVSVTLDNQASQPMLYGGYAPGAQSLIVTNTKIAVTSGDDAVVRFPNTTVADLVEGLRRLKVDTRGVISVLQAVKAAGALHADVIVQ